MNEVLTLRDVTRIYEQGGNRLLVLNRLNLSLKAGEVVALVGPSGSGKTTLLQIAGLLDTPTSGEIALNGKMLSSASDSERTNARKNHIGFVYQFHHLLAEFSATENVMLPQMINNKSRAGAKARAEELLALVGMQHRMNHRPARLSGGECQRVAIARALANNPQLLLADEPTGNLDHHTAEGVFSLLTKTAQEKNVAALIATHNLELAKRMHRIVRLEDGALA